MPGRSKHPTATLPPEPWWARFVLALLKLLLAFALAVLTLLLTRARHVAPLTEPSAMQRRTS